MKNSGDNVFRGIPVGESEADLVSEFLNQNDFAPNTRKAFRTDLQKFARWFSSANSEPFRIDRVTVRDMIDFRNYLRREKGQAVATVNRALVAVRRFFDWLVANGHTETNPAKSVKELRRQQLAPKGLDRSEVRKLLREGELRNDIRAGAIFALFLYTGCRVSDVVNLELPDLMIGDPSGLFASATIGSKPTALFVSLRTLLVWITALRRAGTYVPTAGTARLSWTTTSSCGWVPDSEH